MINKYSELIKENGFLSDIGKKVVAEKFEPAVKELLATMDTENEIRVFGSILSNIIGKEAANIIQTRNVNKQINLSKEDVAVEIVRTIIDPFDI